MDKILTGEVGEEDILGDGETGQMPWGPACAGDEEERVKGLV